MCLRCSKKYEHGDLEKVKKTQTCLKGQKSTGKDVVGPRRIPVAGGFQEQVGRTAVRVWIWVGLDNFWRCFLAL